MGSWKEFKRNAIGISKYLLDDAIDICRPSYTVTLVDNLTHRKTEYKLKKNMLSGDADFELPHLNPPQGYELQFIAMDTDKESKPFYHEPQFIYIKCDTTFTYVWRKVTNPFDFFLDYCFSEFKNGNGIVKYTGNEKNVYIPLYIAGKKIEIIQKGAFGENVKYACVPESIEIESEAFSWETEIERIRIIDYFWK